MFKRTFHKLTDELLVSNTGMDTEMTRPTPCQSKTTNNWNAANESLNEAQHKLTTNSMHFVVNFNISHTGCSTEWVFVFIFQFPSDGHECMRQPPSH